MIEQMTPKERWLAAIHMKPVDRLPFWPKLDGAYPKAQDAPFREMDLDAIHDWKGVGADGFELVWRRVLMRRKPWVWRCQCVNGVISPLPGAVPGASGH